jgi:hypothetical protein
MSWLSPKLNPVCRHALRWAVVAAVFQPGLGHAQTAITGATFGGLVDGVNVGAYTTAPVTFQQTSVSLSTFTTAGGAYEVSGSATTAYVRRNTVNSNNTSLWYNNAGVSTSPDGTYQTTLSSVYLGNNVLMGGDNTFTNGATVSSGNIERIDFVWNAGVVMSTTDGFAVFERGAAAAHDSFRIAVITGFGTATIGGVSTSNVPTSYSTALQATSASYGTNVYNYTNFSIVRYNSGDNLTNDTAVESGTNQGLGGVFFTLADFGIAAGTTIYGYSIFANDWTKAPTKSTQLVDWKNTTYYPTNSTNGLDLSAINGQAFKKIIPEPSTYGLVFMAGSAALVFWRQRRRAARSAA